MIKSLHFFSRLACNFFWDFEIGSHFFTRGMINKAGIFERIVQSVGDNLWVIFNTQGKDCIFDGPSLIPHCVDIIPFALWASFCVGCHLCNELGESSPFATMLAIYRKLTPVATCAMTMWSWQSILAYKFELGISQLLQFLVWLVNVHFH